MGTQSSWTEAHGARLVQLANDKSQQGRALLTTAVVELFSDESRLFTTSDHLVMSEIILQLVETIETDVKIAISERLSKQDAIPHKLAVDMANMESSVAFPILMNSDVLRDPDLISVVMHKTMEHQMAISMRTMIPAGVSRALAESEHDQVVQSLLENKGAEIDTQTYQNLADRVTEKTMFNDTMVRRRDLPQSVANRLYWAVSAALRQELVTLHGVDEDSIDDAIEDIVPEIIEDIADNRSAPDIDRQVELAVRQGDLGKSLLQLLQSAEISRFTAWLASASHLREELVNRIMFEEGGECLAAIFKTFDIDRSDFLSIFVLLRQGRLGDKKIPQDEVRRAADFYAGVKPDRAYTFLKRLQRNPEYLNAIRQVDHTRN